MTAALAFVPAGDDRKASNPVAATGPFVEHLSDRLLAAELDLSRGPRVGRRAVEVAGSNVVQHSRKMGHDIVHVPRRSRRDRSSREAVVDEVRDAQPRRPIGVSEIDGHGRRQ